MFDEFLSTLLPECESANFHRHVGYRKQCKIILWWFNRGYIALATFLILIRNSAPFLADLIVIITGAYLSILLTITLVNWSHKRCVAQYRLRAHQNIRCRYRLHTRKMRDDVGMEILNKINERVCGHACTIIMYNDEKNISTFVQFFQSDDCREKYADFSILYCRGKEPLFIKWEGRKRVCSGTGSRSERILIEDLYRHMTHHCTDEDKSVYPWR